ncbi:MAG TPA: MarR family transcriptional regulator [Ramlibacter sp.]|nr:MarR family transcriptional regulator [Ramlibacter sp.]
MLVTTELHHYPGYLLARARWQAFRAYERAIGGPFELRPVEFSILVLLKSSTEVSQSQLAQALGVAAPNMTGILRRLEARGLIERARSESDKRIQHIVLTRAGLKFIKDAVAAGREMDKPWLGRLSAAEQAMLLELLAKAAAPRAEDAPLKDE